MRTFYSILSLSIISIFIFFNGKFFEKKSDFTVLKSFISKTGTLSNGYSKIVFDERLQKILTKEGTNKNINYDVFIQPLESSNGLYVTNITDKGFEVVENNNGKSNAKFKWMLVFYFNE
ncbi:MAG: hypothetical protein N2203_05600 [Bacteroidia bacterium]|nr:hypothetical protein [Bacteroidia bacterium]